MTLDRLALAALFAAVLANAACTPPPEYMPRQCAGDTDCETYEHCPPPVTCDGCFRMCEPGARCGANADCPADYHCDLPVAFCTPSTACTTPGTLCVGGSFCQPPQGDDQPLCNGVATSELCRGLSPALDVAMDVNGRYLCQPDNACATSDDCRTAERCIDLQCRTDPGCADDAACGPGRACLRGECLVRCDAGEPCPDVTTCTVGACQWLTTPDAQCDTHQLFYADRCHDVCNADHDCPLGFYCDAGLCALDSRPTSFRPPPTCVDDAGCAGGSRCVAGACRASCPGGTDTECRRADVTLTHCDAQGICRP